MKRYDALEMEIISLISHDVIMTSIPEDEDVLLPDGSIELPGISLK